VIQPIANDLPGWIIPDVTIPSRYSSTFEQQYSFLSQGPGVIQPTANEIDFFIDSCEFGKAGEVYKLNCKNSGLTALWQLEFVLNEDELVRKIVPNLFHLCIMRGSYRRRYSKKN